MKPAKTIVPSPNQLETAHPCNPVEPVRPAWVAVVRRTSRLAALIAVCFATGLAAHAAEPSLQPLLEGKWRAEPGNRVSDVKVVSGYAYVALGSSNYNSGGLAVIDVRNPANCVRVGGCVTAGYANSVAVAGNYAYLADSGDESPLAGAGLQVIDVSDPTNCVRVGGYVITNGYASDVVVSGNYAYVAAGGRWTGSNYVGVFEVIDVRNPTNCVRVGGVETYDEALGVAVSGNFAYVADGTDAGMLVIDVSNPTNCVRVGRYRYELSHDTYALDVAVSGSYAYVADFYAGLKVFDVSNPINGAGVGECIISGRATGVTVSGNYAYVSALKSTGAKSVGSLQVIDVSDLTRCVRVASYDTSGNFQAVDVVAGRIHVAGGDAGLLVLPTLRDFQFTVRVDATPGVPFTIEAATNLVVPISWTPLLTTNVPAMPFDYVDFDVKILEKPRKYYRVVSP